jgi:hypothetical protein
LPDLAGISSGFWYLEHSVDGQPFAPIDAQLGSAKSSPVTIAPSGSTTVAFFFLAALGNHGNLTIAFGVLPLRARLFGTLHPLEASGTLAEYVDHPPTFVLSYAVGAETRVNSPPRYHEVVSSLNDLRFTDDAVGVLASSGPVSAGFFDYRIDVQPDDSQVLTLTYGGGVDFLSASTIPLVPKLPTDELGVPADPGTVGLSATTGFTFSVGDQGSMSGTVDLRFAPEG